MKIRINVETTKGVKRVTLDFNIKGIVRDFHSIEDPEEQCRFIEEKLEEIDMAVSLRKKIGLFSRIKVAYLVEFMHVDLILNGLLKMAYDDLEILSKNTKVKTA